MAVREASFLHIGAMAYDAKAVRLEAVLLVDEHNSSMVMRLRRNRQRAATSESETRTRKRRKRGGGDHEIKSQTPMVNMMNTDTQ